MNPTMNPEGNRKVDPPEVVTLRYLNIASVDLKVQVADLDLGDLDPTNPDDHRAIGELAAELGTLEFPYLGICCDSGRGEHNTWSMEYSDENELYSIEANGRTLWSADPDKTLIYDVLDKDPLKEQPSVTRESMIGGYLSDAITSALEGRGSDMRGQLTGLIRKGERDTARKILRTLLTHLGER